MQAPLHGESPAALRYQPRGVLIERQWSLRRLSLGRWAPQRSATLCGAGLWLLASCGVERVLRVESSPPGALVRLDEEVIGTTPLEHPFVHYGTRRLTLYLPGYRTWSEQIPLEPRWYTRFPFDFFTEVVLPLGIVDQRDFLIPLETDEVTETEADIEAFAQRAHELRLREAAAAAARAAEGIE